MEAAGADVRRGRSGGDADGERVAGPALQDSEILPGAGGHAAGDVLEVVMTGDDDAQVDVTAESLAGRAPTVEPTVSVIGVGGDRGPDVAVEEGHARVS